MEAEDHVAASRDRLLVLDLGSRDYHLDAEEFIAWWRGRWPRTGLVLASPGIWTMERHLIAVLGRGAQVLCAPRHVDPEAWWDVLRTGVAGPLIDEIWGDLATVAATLGRSIPYPGEVQSLLRKAPEVRARDGFTKQYARRERRSLTSRMRRAFTDRARTTIYGFRLLWFIKLREEGWTPWDVARFLAYEDSSTAARGLRTVWRLGVRDLEQVSYSTMVQIMVEWLTEPKRLLEHLRSLPGLRARMRFAVTESQRS